MLAHKIQCLFSPSESCHLIAGCPSKLWDKLIQHMRDDHCVDRRRHRDSARARKGHDGPEKKLTQHRILGTQVEAGLARLAVDRLARLKA